jgi:hypothetical protein
MGVPDAISCDHHLFHIRLHLTLGPSCGQSVFLCRIAGVQEASIIRLQSDIRIRRKDVPSGCHEDIICSSHQPDDFYRLYINPQRPLSGENDAAISSSLFFELYISSHLSINFPDQIILLSPLPFLTVFFTLHIQRRYVEPSKTLSLERAVKIDALLDQTPEFSYRAYQQPVLSEPASVPVCETADDALREVIENLTRLQNQESFIRSQNQPLVSSESIIV